jgi:hypothetical protein
MGAPYSLRYDEESGFWGLAGPGQSWPCKWFGPAGKERRDAEIAVVELNAAFAAGAAEERARIEKIARDTALLLLVEHPEAAEALTDLADMLLEGKS